MTSDEIDIRQYLKLLIRHWRWIIGITFGSMLIAAAFSLFILQPVYEASSIIAVRHPLYTINLDTSSESNLDQSTHFYKALPELAAADQVLTQVMAKLQPAYIPEDTSLEEFRNKIDVTSDADTNLVILHAFSENAQSAAEIANTWADIFYAEVLSIYGESDDQLATLNSEFANASTELARSELALIDFQGTNDIPILDAKIASLSATYRSLLQEKTRLEQVTENIRGLRKQFAGKPQSSPVSMEDDLTGLLLQLQAFNTQSTPIQLQISSFESITSKTTGDTIRGLDTLIEGIKAREEQIDAQLRPMEEETLILNKQRAEASSKLEELTQDLKMTQAIYSTLANKLAETRVAPQIPTFGIRIASRAALPESTVKPRKLTITLTAGALSWLLAVTGVIFMDYWKKDDSGI